jgi:glycosyltransferase involved in cell wall biosynthesis
MSVKNNKGNPKKIFHVITGLQTGGAEMMLFKLLSNFVERKEVKSEVVSLMSDGPVGKRIRSLGVPVTTLDMPRGRVTLNGLKKLYFILKKEDPDIVQTWMYHANLIGGLVACISGVERILWNIRSSTLDVNRDKRTTVWVAKLGALLSSCIPDRIVTCASEARSVHADLGYTYSNMTVVPNGFDSQEYRPDEEKGRSIRNEIAQPESLLVGMVARFHPQKDHKTFFKAAARVRDEIENVHFVLCGDRVTPKNDKLMYWVNRNGLQDSVSLLGRRDDVPAVMAALDLFVLSSATGEAFPNVVGEAMSCGVPCVVTDVGDSAEIVDDTGIAVPPEDADRLAGACNQILQLSDQDRRDLGAKARKRIQSHYNLQAIADRYLQVYNEV